MFEKLGRKAARKSLGLTIGLVVVAAIYMFCFAEGAYYTVFGYARFEALRPEEIKDQLVDIDLTVNFGCYIEEHAHNEDGSEDKITSLYYVIWTGDEEAEDFRYMAIKVPVSYYSQMEDMAELAVQGYYSDPLPLSGEITKMNIKETDCFRQYFIDNDFSEEDIQEMTLPYYINVVNKHSKNIENLCWFSIGPVLLIIAIVRLIKAVKGGFLKKLRQDIAAAGYSEASAEIDFATAKAYTKKETIRIGRLFIYYMQGSTVRAIPTKNLVWVYQVTLTHKLEGIIPVAKLNTVNAYVHGNKTAAELKVPNKAAAQEILTAIEQRFPWVVVGHNDALAALWDKNYYEFLNLRFNTVEHRPVVEDF